MAGIYDFIRGIPGKLGVGVADLGFERSQSIPLTSIQGPGVMVRRSLGPTAPGYVKLGQQTVPASWLGITGIYPHGTPNLQTLAVKDKG